MADFYSKLLELRRSESAARGLAKLPGDFYGQSQAYLAEVRRTYEAELRENPSGRKGDVARQTHARALQIARDLIEARMTKLLSAAFQVAVGGGRDLANALPEERALHDRLVESLRGFRSQHAAYLEGVSGAGPAPPAASPPKPAVATGPVTPPEPPRPESRRSGPPAVFVRLLENRPPIEVGGETLELRKDDVLTVSPEVARLLVESRSAERIDARDAPVP